jgi:hypothetical protein
MALVIYLISNLMKLTPKNLLKDFLWPRLAIQLSKEQTKKRPDKFCRDANL